jgi:hypothetical protein
MIWRLLYGQNADALRRDGGRIVREFGLGV